MVSFPILRLYNCAFSSGAANCNGINGMYQYVLSLSQYVVEVKITDMHMIFHGWWYYQSKG